MKLTAALRFATVHKTESTSWISGTTAKNVAKRDPGGLPEDHPHGIQALPLVRPRSRSPQVRVGQYQHGQSGSATSLSVQAVKP